MPDKILKHVIITGRVQGVGYRRWLERMANEYMISGWCKNTASGDVEAVFCGDKDNVASFVKMSKQGTVYARVDKVLELPLTEEESRNIKDGEFIIVHE